jgi:hypothetical protein
MMLALRVAFTAAVMAVVVWLLLTGRPLGALLIVPALAVWARESLLTHVARRLGKT